MKRPLQFILYLVAVFIVLGPLSSLVIWSFAQKWYWPALFPQQYGWLYWSKIADTNILNAIFTSLALASITTVLAMLLTVPFAYVMVRKKFPGKIFLMLLFLLPQAFPQLPIFINLMKFFYQLDLVGTFAGVVMVHLAGGLIYALWIMVSVFQSIPESLELAAYNLGSSPTRTFFQITLPLATPGIIASAILVFIYSLDEFPGSLLIGAPYIKNLSVFMYNTAMGYEVQIASVASILLTIPGVIMLLVMERYIKAEHLASFGTI
jgi:putative spermidine/putrescine transport system permease protein